MATEVGNPAEYDIIRRENDTDDVIVKVKDSSGNLVDTTGWTAQLSVGADDNTIGSGYQATYNGNGSGVDGLIAIDMDLFDIPIGDYKYDIRITTDDADTPARVYAKGKFKVKPRIN